MKKWDDCTYTKQEILLVHKLVRTVTMLIGPAQTASFIYGSFPLGKTVSLPNDMIESYLPDLADPELSKSLITYHCVLMRTWYSGENRICSKLTPVIMWWGVFRGRKYHDRCHRGHCQNSASELETPHCVVDGR